MIVGVDKNSDKVEQHNDQEKTEQLLRTKWARQMKGPETFSSFLDLLGSWHPNAGVIEQPEQQGDSK